MKKTLPVNKNTTVAVRAPQEIISEALAKGSNLETLKELLALQKDWEANEARKLFALSFAAVQAKISSVIKTKTNPQTHSKYADLNDILVSSKPVYTAEGFSVIFYEGDTTAPESVRICADVLHKAGHKETYHYDIPLDGKGIQGNANMTKIHGKSSSVSYARRYLMCMIWNIPTQDDDGDAIARPEVKRPEALSEKKEAPLENIKNAFAKAQKALGDKRFFQILGAEGFEKIEQVRDIATARKIISTMEEAFKNG